MKISPNFKIFPIKNTNNNIAPQLTTIIIYAMPLKDISWALPQLSTDQVTFFNKKVPWIYQNASNYSKFLSHIWRFQNSLANQVRRIRKVFIQTIGQRSNLRA